MASIWNIIWKREYLVEVEEIKMERLMNINFQSVLKLSFASETIFIFIQLL